MKRTPLNTVVGVVLLFSVLVMLPLLSACGEDAELAATSTSALQTDTTTATTSEATTDAEFKLLFATYSAEKGFGSDGLRAFGQALEEKTGGRVKVEYSYAQALGTIPQYYDLLVNGTADVVFYSPYQTTGMFPLSEVGTLPFVVPTAEVGSKALDIIYRAGLLDEKMYTDTKTLFVTNDRGSNFRNSIKPVTTLADCAKMKIMVPGGEINSLRASAMGVVPVVITGTDVYPALQKGTIDGQITGWAPMKQFKWCEVNHYATEPLIGGSPWVVGMNWETYNNLPTDIQQIIDEMSKSDEYMLAAAAGTDALNEASRECFLSSGGQIDEWTPEALEEMGKNMASVWDKWISDNEAKGLAARKLVDGYYHALQDLGVSSPAIGYTPQS